MELQSILKADYLDIIFDNRNKTYGGYELRKNYRRRTTKAITIVLSAALLLIGVHAFASRLKPANVITLKTNERVIEMRELDPPVVPPPPPPPPVPPAPVPPAPSVIFTPPVIKPDIDVPEPPATVEDLKNKNPGTENSKGDPNSPPGPPSDIIGDGDGPAKSTVVETTKPEGPREYVEQMPEFEGNLNEYLSRNIQYPPAAREANITGRVVIKFVVNEDGSISGAKLVKGIGGGCEEEAMRVINGMPHWKAGKTNGKAVKVYFTLPVSFRLN